MLVSATGDKTILCSIAKINIKANFQVDIHVYTYRLRANRKQINKFCMHRCVWLEINVSYTNFKVIIDESALVTSGNGKSLSNLKTSESSKTCPAN